MPPQADGGERAAVREIDKAFKKKFGGALPSGAVHELLARLALQKDSMYARFVEQQVRAQLAWQGG